MNSLLTRCPVCSGELLATRLHCPSCETTLEGEFSTGEARLQEVFSPEQLRPLLPFSRLNQEQLYFVLTFVRCEGRFNRMEEELGLSYPTLRSRLDDLILALGFNLSAEDEPQPGTAQAALKPVDRQAILEQLNRGELSVEEARLRLRGEQVGIEN
jgi:hypothetical protein